ncbi:hypothetical protein CPB83DRAFT_864199 [Crepidotus variabilis]|uniref:Uncharacterized protein n=1 Tax=Crepidotus variabilis TaxID=179855 RepID=A0A9P6JJ81_9AGAR|nr:hypothetical protein CPB83DRAFT_864199 [Crepidotus variabilis]
MFLSALIIASFVALGSAQISGIGQQCMTALEGVLASPDASGCLNTGALLALGISNNSTFVPALNTWVTGLCGQPACSNATLSAVTQNITSGCSTELKALGVNTDKDSTSQLTQDIQTYYPTVRKVFCLKDGGNLCINETFTNLANSLGGLSLASLSADVTDGIKTLTNLPNNITCTDCIKETYNIVVQDFPKDQSVLQAAAKAKCGASFVDGSAPSTVSQSANSAVQSTKSAALGHRSMFADSFFGAATLLIVPILSTFA